MQKQIFTISMHPRKMSKKIDCLMVLNDIITLTVARDLTSDLILLTYILATVKSSSSFPLQLMFGFLSSEALPPAAVPTSPRSVMRLFIISAKRFLRMAVDSRVSSSSLEALVS